MTQKSVEDLSSARPRVRAFMSASGHVRFSLTEDERYLVYLRCHVVRW